MNGVFALHLDGMPKTGRLVRLRTFLKAAGTLQDLLSEVAGGMHERQGKPIDWLISDMHIGSAALALIPSGRSVSPDFGERVAREVVAGIDSIQNRGLRPASFSDDALRLARELALHVGRGASSLRVGINEPSMIVNRDLEANARALLVGNNFELGMLEGVLKVISLAGRPKFNVYDVVTGRAVACHLADDSLHQVIAALGRRVAVSGTVVYAADGHPRAIHDVTAIEAYPADDELPSTQDILALPINWDRDSSSVSLVRDHDYE